MANLIKIIGASKSSGFFKVSNSLNEKPYSPINSPVLFKVPKVHWYQPPLQHSSPKCVQETLAGFTIYTRNIPGPKLPAIFSEVCLSSLFAISGPDNQIKVDTWHAKLCKSS